MTKKGHPWNKDPYELCYDEAAGMFADDEMEVVVVDFKKRNWRKGCEFFQCGRQGNT